VGLKLWLLTVIISQLTQQRRRSGMINVSDWRKAVTNFGGDEKRGCGKAGRRKAA